MINFYWISCKKLKMSNWHVLDNINIHTYLSVIGQQPTNQLTDILLGL